MATNLGSSNGTTFNKTNMKPESGEQIDALWGQNEADNIMYLYTRREVICNAQLAHDSRNEPTWGTFYFRKEGNPTNLYGSISGRIQFPAGNNIFGTFYVDGTIVLGTTLGTAGTAVEMAFSHPVTGYGTTEQLSLSWEFAWEFDRGVDDSTMFALACYLE